MSIYFHDNSAVHTASGLGQNAGDILQTVGPYTLTSHATTTSTSYQDSGMSLNITPSSTSSKILIIACLDTVGYGDRDRRPNTCICYGSVSSSNRLAQQVAGEYHTGDSGSYSYGGHTYWILHSPSTTSQVTYRVGLASLDGSTVRIFGDSSPDTRSFMYLQEVKG